MKEIVGDLFNQENVDIICIPTNGSLNRNGNAVMGAGVALECKKRFPFASAELGRQIKINGNKLFHILTTNLGRGLVEVWSFPVKHNWYDKKADLDLIKQSALQLVRHAEIYKKIVLPRIGCGLGELDWEKEVKPVCEKYLDDRFYVINNEESL